MSNSKEHVRLWLVIEGPSGAARVTGVSLRAPRRGRRVEVSAPVGVVERGAVWLLARKEPADVVLAVAALEAPLLARKEQLGKVAPQYEVIQVPIVERAPIDQD